MFIGARRGLRFSLRVKLLTALIPVMAISIFLAMAGLGWFLRDFFHHRSELETMRLGLVAKSALRQTMLRNPERAMNETLADLGKAPGIRRVWIIDKNGRVAHSADRSLLGKVLDKRRDARCTVCHSNGKVPEAQTYFTQDEAGIPIVRHLSLIENEKECWGCHDSKVRLNGVLLLEDSTESFHDAMWTVERRLGATGILTLTLIIIVTLVVTTKFIEYPIRRLMAGVRQLGTGDLSVRIPVRGRDELGELASGFNQMAGDLGTSLEEIRNKNAELSVVYSILERLTKTIDLVELKEIILQTLIDVLESDRVLLMSNLTPHQSREILIRTRGVERIHRITEAEERGTLPECFPSDVAGRWEQGELHDPFVTSDKHVAVVPVRIRQTNLGLILIQRDRPLKHSEANQQLLAALAEHIGVAFENARLYTLAITDELTQLFTVRCFQNRAEECISRFQRYEQTFGVLMLDLDHFKRVNDEWGHPVGDEVLRRVAGSLLRSIRAVDSAYRYGGEEFALLLPEIDLSGARIVAERVRQTIQQLEMPVAGERTLNITVSIGIAICPENGRSVQELVAAADAALYEAKRAGRNRVGHAMARASDLQNHTPSSLLP